MFDLELKDLSNRTEFKNSLLINFVMPFRLSAGLEVGYRAVDDNYRAVLKTINDSECIRHQIEEMILDEMWQRAGTVYDNTIINRVNKWDIDNADPINELIMASRSIRHSMFGSDKLVIIANPKTADFIEKQHKDSTLVESSIMINDHLLSTVHGMPIIRVDEQAFLDNNVLVAVAGEQMGMVLANVSNYKKTKTFHAKAIVIRPNSIARLTTGLG